MLKGFHETGPVDWGWYSHRRIAHAFASEKRQMPLAVLCTVFLLVGESICECGCYECFGHYILPGKKERKAYMCPLEHLYARFSLKTHAPRSLIPIHHLRR